MPKIRAPLYAYSRNRHIAPIPGIDNAKIPEMEQELFAAFRKRRREGRSCKPNWFKKKADQIMRSTFPNQAEEFKGSNGWFVRFCNRFDLVPRMKTNKKKKSAAEKEPVIEHFHSSLRQFLATNNGRTARYNVDQVPMPFAYDFNVTYEEEGAKEVWISQFPM